MQWRGNRRHAPVAPHTGAWIETPIGTRLSSHQKSPLTQGRGSKPFSASRTSRGATSPLTQGRGSKHLIKCCVGAHGQVAPHTGAWIETMHGSRRGHRVTRRPSHRGVDRNNRMNSSVNNSFSRPSHRGVDRNVHIGLTDLQAESRPSHRGVDRNNKLIKPIERLGASPLTQGRGSKQHATGRFGPVWTVAPHTGAWIETPYWKLKRQADHVAPHTGAWIETYKFTPCAELLLSPLTQGRGSKQQQSDLFFVCVWSPLTQGRGSKPTC